MKEHAMLLRDAVHRCILCTIVFPCHQRAPNQAAPVLCYETCLPLALCVTQPMPRNQVGVRSGGGEDKARTTVAHTCSRAGQDSVVLSLTLTGSVCTLWVALF